MHIICPHCTTSYAINPATLGAAGRTVRCSRCKETWLARPEDAIEMAKPCRPPCQMRRNRRRLPRTMPRPNGRRWRARKRAGRPGGRQPLDFGRLAGRAKVRNHGSDWPSAARPDAEDHAEVPITTHRQRLARLLASLPRIPFMPSVGLPTACAAMGALILALMIWRADVVRLLPQTATFYKMVGLEVNLRGLAFKDIKVTNETVDGKPVLVIEGTIVGESKNRSNCRGCAFRSATRKAPRSTPGTRCSSSRCSIPASAPISSRGWLRRRPKVVILTYAFSTSGIWPATPEPAAGSAGARETTSCHAC